MSIAATGIRSAPAAQRVPAQAVTPVASALAARIPVEGVSAASVGALAVTLPDGNTTQLTVRQAVERGLVKLAPDGLLHVTWAGRRAGVRIAAAPARRAVLAQEGEADGKEQSKPKLPSEMMTEMGRAGMFASGALKLARGPGLPSPLSLYFFANSANRYSGNRLLPGWAQKGPIKDLIEFGLVSKMWIGSIKALPGAHEHLRVAQAKSGAGLLSFAKAAVSTMPEDKAAANAAAATARRAANVPGLAKLFPLIAPLTKIAFTLYAGASIVALPEYLREHGSKGLLNTKTGRGALLGAIDGVMMLPVLHAPTSPATLWADVVSNTAWLLGLINGKGWLDPILGGDPPKADTPPSGGATAAQAGAQVTAALQPDLQTARRQTSAVLATATMASAAAARAVSRSAQARRT